ncbi:hypothetical protein [Halomonas faecis]|uniref:hypothetical protein n=1 Tax=Halomonas faecis TaxID=1562110 RepID=UPI0013D29EB0|nr:hypothetical protein [Halomonas faecis]
MNMLTILLALVFGVNQTTHADDIKPDQPPQHNADTASMQPPERPDNMVHREYDKNHIPECVDKRVFGYWYLSDEEDTTPFESVEYVEWLSPNGNVVTIPTGGDAKRDDLMPMQATFDCDTVVFRASHIPQDYEYSYEMRDDNLVYYSNDDGGFYYRRLPSDTSLLKALLRLVATGEVESFDTVNAEGLLGIKNATIVDLIDSKNQLMLIHQAEENMVGMIQNNGEHLALSIDPSVLALSFRASDTDQIKRVLNAAKLSKNTLRE